MLKIIIADDEDKICQLIYKLVDWKSIEMEVVGIAHNGIEALELVKSHNPDVAITDIRMPGYDGLEFIGKAKEVNPDIEFIIISGYQHFEYAQKAIKYGVSDYLLKPIKKDELITTLTTMKDHYLVRAEQLSKEEKMKLSLKNNMVKLRNSFLNEILLKKVRRMKDISIDVINREYQYNFKEGCFQILTLKLDGLDQTYFSNVKFLEEKIVLLINNNLKEYCYDLESFFVENICYSILNFSLSNKKLIRRQCKILLDEIALQKDIFENLESTIGLGTVETDLSTIDDSLKTAIWSYEQRLVVGTNRVIDYDFTNTNQLADSQLFYDFNKQMDSALERLDKSAVVSSIRFLREGIKKRPETSGHEIVQMTKEVCNLFLITIRKNKFLLDENTTFFEEFSSNVNNFGSVNSLFNYLINSIVNLLDKIIEDKKQLDTKPIRDAKQYIQENYQNSITLEDVSTRVGFNATYFSSLFKKDTGYTFLEYLSEVRMNQAKILLKETNLGVAAICEKVGYSDVKHFTKMFTKHIGLKPNEYRKLYS